MKRLGLLLLAVSVLAGLASCGGSGGPSEITPDISGRWSVKWDDSSTAYVLALEQDADGVVVGRREGFTGYTHVTGQRIGNSKDYTLWEETYSGPQLSYHWVTYGYGIRLQGTSFKGKVTYNRGFANPTYDCEGTKLR